jgi:hypothetical protein
MGVFCDNGAITMEGVGVIGLSAQLKMRGKSHTPSRSAFFTPAWRVFAPFCGFWPFKITLSVIVVITVRHALALNQNLAWVCVGG